MRRIEVPTEIFDDEMVESPEDQYSFELTKHETYRQEMLVTVVIKTITDIVLSATVLIAAIIFSKSQAPITVLGFGLSICGVIVRLFNSLADHTYNLRTLYNAHIKEEDVPDRGNYDQIMNLLVLLPFLAGLILSVFIKGV